MRLVLFLVRGRGGRVTFRRQGRASSMLFILVEGYGFCRF